MMSIYAIVRIQLSFVQFSLLCYEFCILSKAECKSIYYHFRCDHEDSSFQKLARNKWICQETSDFFFRDQFTLLAINSISLITFFQLENVICVMQLVIRFHSVKNKLKEFFWFKKYLNFMQTNQNQSKLANFESFD